MDLYDWYVYCSGLYLHYYNLGLRFYYHTEYGSFVVVAITLVPLGLLAAVKASQLRRSGLSWGEVLKNLFEGKRQDKGAGAEGD